MIADVTTSTSTTTDDDRHDDDRDDDNDRRRRPRRHRHDPPAGVRVAGVRVGGAAAARRRQPPCSDAFAKPLPVVVDRSRLVLDPAKFASVYTDDGRRAGAHRARRARTSTLVVAVRGAPLRAWVAGVEKRFARAPVDATLKLKNGKPFLTKDKAGRRLDTTRLTERIVAALRANTRLPVRVRTQAGRAEGLRRHRSRK